MLKAFKTILVPVDFTVNTEVAISKTLAMIDREEAVICLLHVLPSLPFSSPTVAHAASLKKLEEWKVAIEECRDGVRVQYELREGSSVQAAIRQAAAALQPDVVVIGQSGTYAGFSLFRGILPMKLALATGLPVLTVKPGSLHSKIKTVVVPVSDTLPESKMQALEVLCRNVKLNIHLITLVDDSHAPSDFSASTLLQMYQWLKTRLRCPVEYAVVHGGNKAKAILHYAEKMNADILLVQPEKETKIGWGDRHISDVLPRTSKMQVLAVGTAH